MKLPLSGLILPLLTPLCDRDELDHGGLERLIEHGLAGGVHAIFLLGSTGEAPSLSSRTRRDLVAHACRIINGRVPVLVGITDTSFTESVRLAEFASDRGADAVVVAPPFYLPPSSTELRDYIFDLMLELPLPLVLYNMPALCKVSFDLSVVEEVMQHEGIIGIKDSSGDMMYVQSLLKLARSRPDWSVLIGQEELTAEGILMGAQGGISSGANLHPRLYVDLYEAAIAGNVQRVRELQMLVLRIGELLYHHGETKSGWILGLKCALSQLGICHDRPAEPLRPFDRVVREQIREKLSVLGLQPTTNTRLGVRDR